MPQITWRNVNTEPQGVQGFLGAGELFNRAGSGFRESAADLFKLRDMESSFITNQAIADVLSGRVLPNQINNPRVDAGLLEDAFMAQKKNKSGLLTETLNQRAQDMTYQQNLLDYGQDPAEFAAAQALSESQRQSEIAQRGAFAAAQERDAFGLIQDREEFSNLKEDRALVEKNRADLSFLDQQMVDLETTERNRLLTEAYKEGTLKSGEQPSQALWDEIGEKAQAYAQGRGGRTVARELMRSRPGGFNQAAWDASIFGKGDARAAAIEDQLTAQQKTQYEADVKTLGKFEADMRWGNFDGAMASSTGELVPASENDLRSNAKSFSDAQKYLGNQGLPVDKYGDTEKEAIEKIIEVFPHPSIFVPIVKSFTVNGKFDAKEAIRAVRTDGGQAALDQAKIARGNETRGFSIGEVQAGGGGSAPPADTGPNPAAVGLLKAALSDIATDAEIDKLVKSISVAGDLATENPASLITKALMGKLKRDKEARAAQEQK